MSNKTIQKGTVRIVMPASVGYDLKKFKKCLALVARRLGHPTCASGLPNCSFSFEGPVLMFDEKLAVHDVALPVSPAIGRNPTVTLGLPDAVSNSLTMLSQVVEQVAARLGCRPCTSGFDLLFQQELDSFSFQVTEKGSLA
jgi:hypothetical protein